MLNQVPKTLNSAGEVLTFWVPFSGPFLADFWIHFGVDFGSICGARAGPRHHHRSAIFNEKTRGFRRGVQQNSRVLWCKKAVDKRFVETKSTPMHLLEKVSKTHGFCKDRCQNVQKPMGFLQSKLIVGQNRWPNDQKPIGFFRFWFIAVQKPMRFCIFCGTFWYTSCVKC